MLRSANISEASCRTVRISFLSSRLHTAPTRRIVAAAISDPKAAEKAAKRAAAESTALELFHSTYSPSAPLESSLQVIKEACRTKGVAPRLVAGALVHLERTIKTTKRSTLPVSDLVQNLTQKPYTLVFSTVVPIEALQYIPVTEYLSFTSPSASSPSGEMTMWSEIGPIHTFYSGKFSWADGVGTTPSSPPPSPAAIDFTMPDVRVELFGKQVSQKTREQQLRRYTFLFVDEQLAVARSSSGGFTVMFHE